MTKKRILIFIVAYNHEKLIDKVLSRIPHDLTEHDTEILIIDDASRDLTFEKAEAYKKENKLPYKINVLVNPTNQRYGGNQKIGFHYAIENGFDILALVHGDGQYAPEALPKLLAPIISGEVDGVMGSRMADKFGALKGGMPLYKYIGNKILTAYQNFMLGTDLYEFHTGYRLYSVEALKKIPFDLVTNEFHFDNEIFIQLHLSGLKAIEIPIDTFYGDEVCNVDGFRYAWDIFKTTGIASLQGSSLFYRRKWDLPMGRAGKPETVPSKLGFDSSHRRLVDAVAPGSKVLNIGIDGGHVARALKDDKNCDIIGFDDVDEPLESPFSKYRKVDLDTDFLPEDLSGVDTVILGDVVGRFREPEAFMTALAARARAYPSLRVIATNGNVTFITNRLLILLGRFNYGKRGILSQQHRRLFTPKTLRALFDQYGFEVESLRGIPAPFPLVLGNNPVSRGATVINRFFSYLSTGLFAYQIMIKAKPRPALAWLLAQAKQETATRKRNPRS